jgi:hypothetical protein
MIFRLEMDAAQCFISTVPAVHLAVTRLHLSLPIRNPLYVPPGQWPVNSFPEEAEIKADEAKWEAFWRHFSQVSVRDLQVEILDVGFRANEQLLLQPLKDVRAHSIDVLLPWPIGLSPTGSFQNTAFNITRPPEGVDLMIQWNVDRAMEIFPPPRRRLKPFWKRLIRR